MIQRLPAARQRRILTVLTGGGFTFEATCVLRELADTADFFYLTTWSGGTPGEQGIPLSDRVYSVPQTATVTKPSRIQSVIGVCGTWIRSIEVLLLHRIDLVFTVGCSHAIPVLLAAKLFRKKTVFLESITRADKLSVTGSLVYKLRLADRFIVQWPELHKNLPRSCLGTIL
jgi:UDP-N-acetylglucosamine:LPS N-acetylglucosamine transferase